jgi:ABC-type branched-subunit amino acid transport system ATPase component
MPDLLIVDSLVKRFGGLTALDGVSLSLKQAGLYGLIGPNGSGKTTLMNIVCGLYKPDAGRIIFNEIDITNHPAHTIAKMGIARTFQTPREFPNLTVEENVNAIYRSGSNCSIQESLSLTGLADKGNLMAKDLPYGQKKQLEFARTLARGADLIMLDEPMGGLDYGQIKELNKTILDVHKKFGKTFLIIEHRLDELAKLVDWIFVLKNGAKIAEGDPDSIANNSLVHIAYFGDA